MVKNNINQFLKLVIMKISFWFTSLVTLSMVSFNVSAQTNKKDFMTQSTGGKSLFIDVHHLGPGNVNADAVAKAHAKDLATEKKYGVNFLKYWVDEKEGVIMCLAEAKDSASIAKTHKEAHGLLPDHVYKVTDGEQAALKGNKNLFLDIHQLGAGNVTAKDVAAAHQKDLVVEKKYDVNFINYWVDEKNGVVMCLAEAKDSAAMVQTHKEAHGLIPQTVMKVKQSQ
jgi:hypothetical protein